MKSLDFLMIEQTTKEKLLKCGKVIEVAKGTQLIRQGEQTSFIYYQISGKSMIYNMTHSGNRKILFVLGSGALLNEHIFNSHASSIFCEAMEKSKIFCCPVEDFVSLMKEDFSLAKHVIDAQEKKIWRLGHQLKNTMSSIYLERKLAAKLWKLSRDFGNETPDGIEIDLNLSVTFLADMLGVPRETTSRVCATLVNQNLIRMNKKRITIVNPKKMVLFYKNGTIE